MSSRHFKDILWTFPASPGHLFDIFLAHPRKGSWDMFLTFWRVLPYYGLTAVVPIMVLFPLNSFKGPLWGNPLRAVYCKGLNNRGGQKGGYTGYYGYGWS